MNGSSRDPLRAHEDRDLFREMVRHTAATTGFADRLVEKDYFCSVLLQHFAQHAPELVFKGGTCLAKVHIGFYRMSEDLDFSISTPSGSKASQRSKLAANAKSALSKIETEIPTMRALGPLQGANGSMQYAGEVAYDSVLGSRRESILVEVALREELLRPAALHEAMTLLVDPFTGKPHAPAVKVSCIHRTEAFAEKLRAALSRRVPAIRDFYDLDHVVRTKEIDLGDGAFLEMVRAKLRIEGNAGVDVSDERLAALRPQIGAQLQPVLRARDFRGFDLERSFRLVREVAAATVDGGK